MRSEVSNDTIRYIEDLFAVEDELLKSVREECEKLGRGGVQIRAFEGRLLQVLMRMIGSKNVLEIGMFLGYSTIWMARALPENGVIYTLEKEEAHVSRARDFFARGNLTEKINIVKGDARESLRDIESFSPFDFIFIDANKGAYAEYLQWAMGNLRSGGVIVADNTLLFGKVMSATRPEGVSQAQWENMRAFNQRLALSLEFTSILVPTDEGLTVAVKI